VSRRRAGPVRRFLRRSRLYRSAETRWRYLHSRGGIWRWVVYGTGGLFVLAVIWLVATGLVARNDASTIRSRLSEVQRLVAAGDVHDAQKVAATIPALAHRAHKLTTGPAWFLASEVPYFGKPLQVVRGTAAATDVLGSQGVTALLSVIGDLDPAKLRVRGDTVNLAPIIEAAPKLKVVDVAIDNALHDLRKVPSARWFTPRQRGCSTAMARRYRDRVVNTPPRAPLERRLRSPAGCCCARCGSTARGVRRRRDRRASRRTPPIRTATRAARPFASLTETRSSAARGSRRHRGRPRLRARSRAA